MCWCTPEIRTPNCGKIGCHPPNMEKETWEAAAEEIRGWMRLQVKAIKEVPYANPKEALREHNNQMNQLGVILSSFLKKAGHDPKEVFKELQTWSKGELK